MVGFYCKKIKLEYTAFGGTGRPGSRRRRVKEPNLFLHFFPRFQIICECVFKNTQHNWVELQKQKT